MVLPNVVVLSNVVVFLHKKRVKQYQKNTTRRRIQIGRRAQQAYLENPQGM
jgi:hypothetical protein